MRRLLSSVLATAWLLATPLLAHGAPDGPVLSFDRTGVTCEARTPEQVVDCIDYCRAGALLPSDWIERGDVRRRCGDLFSDDWLPFPQPHRGDVPV